ncbi:MAG: molybdenum ABC transporter ATP-binding protein, partial [Magnetococcales bacterium]|nr:molybdenum ABC transporter ATP-binding protein [Magnetococcales bacterium]
MTIEVRFAVAWPGFSLEVDFSCPGQGVTALYGHSGSGKTTLLRAIAGLERIPDGRLLVNGERWQEGQHFVPVHRRPLGYVFQEASLFAHLSVRDNLGYGERRAGGHDPVRFRGVVEMLGIGPLLSRWPDRLSGGERQRVAIARALLTRPRLLLMDEPLASLDQARKEEILPYLEQLHRELEIPLLYVSHAPDEVARLADHLVMLSAGRVLGHGSLTSMLARLDLPTRLGEEAGVVWEATVLERDPHWHLAQVACAGGRLWVRDAGHALGSTVRVRILARDVSLALQPQSDSSILNALPAQVSDLGEDAHPALCLVRLQVGALPLLARLTQRSV